MNWLTRYRRLPILGAFLLWRERRSPGRIACLLVPAAVLVGALLVYDALVWHAFGLAPNQVNAGAVPFSADRICDGRMEVYWAAWLALTLPVIDSVVPVAWPTITTQPPKNRDKIE